MTKLQQSALKQAVKAYSVFALDKHDVNRINTEVPRLKAEGQAYVEAHERATNPDLRAFNYLWEQISIYVKGYGRSDLKWPNLKSKATVKDLHAHLLSVVQKWTDEVGDGGEEPRPPLTFFGAKQRNRLALGTMSKQAEQNRQAHDDREARVRSEAQALAAQKNNKDEGTASSSPTRAR